MSSFRLPYTRLFLPCLLEPKKLYSKWAKLDPKIVLYFTHRNGPIFGSKTDLFDLQCVVYKFQCNLCDAGYVGYTRGHLHERVDGHKQKSSSICKHYTLANIIRTYHLVFQNNYTCLPNVLTSLIA